MERGNSPWRKQNQKKRDRRNRGFLVCNTDADSQVSPVLSFDQEDRIRVDEDLRRRQVEFLSVAAADLEPLSELLNADGCYDYLCTHLITSRRLLCEHSFRMLCNQYASKFKDGRFERLTQRYSDRR